MNPFTIALICLSLAGLFKAQSMTPAEEQGVGLESGGTLTEESPDRECPNAVLSVAVSVLEGRVIDTLRTDTIFECCQACQEQEGCTSWTRDRNDGECLLYEIESAVIWRNPWFESDIGGFPVDTQGPLDVSELGVSPSSEATRSITTDSGTPLENIIRTNNDFSIPDCAGTRGNTYPMGDVIIAGETRSPQFCCEVCRELDICKSWYYNANTNNCVINGNVPEVRSRSASQYLGGISDE